MRAWPIGAVETEMRRLKALQYLLAIPSYEASGQMLAMHCRQIGVPTTADQMVTCLAWLQEMELLTLRSHAEEPIAKLTAAGRDVATGDRMVPGVIRPDP